MEVKNQFQALCFFLILCFAAAPARAQYHTESVPRQPMSEMVTHLKFYLHDTLSGDKPTAVRVARSDQNDTSPLSFGSVYAIDDPMTVGPELSSGTIGNARGMYLSGSRDDLTLVMYVDFGFTAGKFNGSSFSVFSRNPVAAEARREVAVVGGRGKFRMARGFAKIRTHFLNMTNGDAILQYKVTLFHY